MLMMLFTFVQNEVHRLLNMKKKESASAGLQNSNMRIEEILYVNSSVL